MIPSTHNAFAGRRFRAAKPPWQDVLDAAQKSEARFVAAIKGAARATRETFDTEAVERALSNGDPRDMEYRLGFAVATFSAHLERTIPGAVARALAAGGEAAAKDARTIGRFRTAVVSYVRKFDGLGLARDAARREVARVRRDARNTAFDNLHFDLVNPEALRAAAEQAGRLIVDITQETRAAIRSIIARSFTEGITTQGSARLIRELVGLTEPYANAVLNLRLQMLSNPGKKIWAGRTPIRVPRDGASFDLLMRRGGEYARRLLNLRARTIARTETITASNQGQLQLWKQAMDRGLLRFDEAKVWIVTPDDRLCPICKELGGEVVFVNRPFSTGDFIPPAHPSCRCTMGLTRERPQVLQ